MKKTLRQWKNKIDVGLKNIDWCFLYQFALACEFLFIALIIVFTVFKQDFLVSLLYRATFGVLAFGVFCRYMEKRGLSILQYVFIELALLCFVNVFVSGAGFSMMYYKKPLIFLCTILLWLFIDDIKPAKKMVEWILILNFVLSVFYILAYTFSAEIKVPRWLNFNFTNPNLTGMFLLYNILYSVLGIFYYKNKWIRVSLLITTLGGMYLLYLTQARGSIFSLCFFVALLIYIYLFAKALPLKGIISLILILIPLFFVLIYLLFYELDLLSLLSFTEISEGKEASGRVEVWGGAFKVFLRYWFTGNYKAASDAIGHLQMHNTHLDVLASYGVVVFLAFIWILYNVLNKNAQQKKTRLQEVALAAFYTSIVVGCFEAALVSGGAGIYILNGGLLLISKYNAKQDVFLFTALWERGNSLAHFEG